jgi:ABC-type multidrug transport system ATPase subunit
MHAIETRGLTCRFAPAETVLRDVDLEVESGSIYGFLGPNGAGRVTAALVAGGLAVHEITTVRKDLEHTFLDLIGAG